MGTFLLLQYFVCYLEFMKLVI